MLHGGTAGWLLAGMAVALAACTQPDAARLGRPAFGRQQAASFGAGERSAPPIDADASADAAARLQDALSPQGAATGWRSQEGAANEDATTNGRPAAGGSAAASDADAGAGMLAGAREAVEPPLSERERERRLRAAFADAAEPTEAALHLAGFLAQRERIDEALFVVDRALERERSMELRIARAGLLRDLADVAGAAQQLRDLVRELGTAGCAPGTLFELAQVDWLAGHRDDARAVLRALQDTWAGNAWLVENRDAIDELRRSIEEDKVHNAMGVRDLLALLRTAPQVTSRIKLLERIATPTGEAADAERLPLRLRAIAISGADESPAVRSRGLQLAAANGVLDPDYWRAALADEAALPRKIAARSCARTLADDAIELLAARLAIETDTSVAGVLHKQLARLCGASPPTTFDLGTAEGRAEAAAHWRAQRG